MLITNLAILVLAGFVGFAVISKVPNTLHTPLMSGTNAIHGIVVLAGLLVIGLAANDIFNKVILVIAIAFGTINVVGGFLVTDRMLGMFKRKPEPRQVEEKPEPEPLDAPTAPPVAPVDSREPDRAAAAAAPQSDGPAAASPQSDGPAAASPQSDGPAAGSPQSDGPAAAAPQSDGPAAASPAPKDPAQGAAAGESAPEEADTEPPPRP